MIIDITLKNKEAEPLTILILDQEIPSRATTP
jgi:hypothetical protein